jgi:acetyl-CoA acetyltransferase
MVLAYVSEMSEFDLRKINPDGGAVAIGHPLGCSGARLATTLIHTMRRTGRCGPATMCIGVGRGITTAFEVTK